MRKVNKYQANGKTENNKDRSKCGLCGIEYHGASRGVAMK